LPQATIPNYNPRMPRLVALTTTTAVSAGSDRRPQISLWANYITALENAGLTPVLITPAHSIASVGALVGRCSGLVLSGGEDVDPARYGEAPLPNLGRVSPDRDAMEFAALAAALERNLPILGICRGCQVLNVFMGGTLYQDIETQCPGALGHRQSEPWGRRPHAARVEPGTRLDALVGSPELCINSFHHQAIKAVAPGLRVSAWAEDGLIEAIEAPDGRWLVGVQWHPERHEASTSKSDPDVRIFDAFGEAVASFPDH
jgi:putative glutamine amidotransferase